MAPRVEFAKELKNLHQEIIRMGATVEDAINDAILALTDMDVDLAQKVIENDDVIDDMEVAIDKQCVALIARQQPVASDLRDVTSTLKLITDLERIADHASDISERIIEIKKLGSNVPVPHEIVTIANMAKNMLHAALDAYVAQDEKKAGSVISMDDKVDELYRKLKKYLTHLMSVDSANISELVEMLLITKYVERIADHAQNVAEWVLFYIQGRYIIHESDVE